MANDPAVIVGIAAREILDSRGNPTLEVDVFVDDGAFGRAGVPSGASTGSGEALELRDHNDARFRGKGVQRAVDAVTDTIAPEVLGLDVTLQSAIDQVMLDLDGTPNKSNLGVNAILGVSLACARAAAQSLRLPLYRYLGGPSARLLPVPLLNVINGGAHADNALDIQEFMLIPLGAGSFGEALRMGVETYHALKDALLARGLSTGVGDEGGFAPDLRGAEAALGLLLDAIQKAGYEPGRDIALGLDVAATELYQDGVYRFAGEETERTAESLVAYYTKLIDAFPIISIEDGLAEDDWEGWRLLTEALGRRVQLVGDDLFVTNLARLDRGIESGVANSILIKPNQIGTLTETIATIERAKQAGYTTVLSHRSGETDDTTISDLAVGMNLGQIKAGAPCRGERVAKYNQLLRIEEELGGSGRFDGPRSFYNLTHSKTHNPFQSD